MPETTLTRNKKTGGWDKNSKALPSEIEQKKQGLAVSNDALQSEKKTAEKKATTDNKSSK